MTKEQRPFSQPATKPHRRWHQFSLRTLLIGTAVIGVFLAVGLRWIAPAQRQRAAVQMVNRLGGSVAYADAHAKGSWIVTRLRDWLPRDYLDNVVGASFVITQVADADLVHLNGFRNLAQLELSGNAVTDEGLTHLKGLTQLRVIYLDGTQVTDVGLIHLKGLARLRVIYLDNTPVTDAGLLHLSGLKQLEAIYLNNTQVTVNGAAELRKALPQNCAIVGPGRTGTW